MELLKMKSIRKAFFGVEVLHDVDFELRKGEVHALIGENGAGKSTLMKVLMGEHPAEKGEVYINGKAMKFSSPSDALKNGVAKVHQELSPILDMSVSDNIFLGREIKRLFFVNQKEQNRRTKELFDSLGLDINPSLLMKELSVAETQMVEIAKAVSFDSQILIFDEPTSAITNVEVDKLFEIIRKLTEKGVGVIYISHKLDELYEIADRITVLRDGSMVLTSDIENLNKQQLINAMVGRELTELYPRTVNEIGEPLLSVEGLCKKGQFSDISFHVNRGEILGLAGLMGSGRTEVCMAIFGATRADKGTVSVDGRRVSIKKPINAIQLKMALITEDRKLEGLNLTSSVEENILGVMQRRLAKCGFILRRKSRANAQSMIGKFNIKIHSLSQLVSNLSGGNQQKVVIAKWSLTEPDIFIFDEPTRGVDVGAKAEIYKIINELASQGKAILMVSSEMPEVIGMCDRVLVMRNGRLAGELPGGQITQENIMKLAAN